MQIEITSGSIRFHEDGRIAGEYRVDDAFKPHFTRLLTPAGHNTVLVSPADHPHHKGLMFALRCADLNFWEEHGDPATIGRQEVLDTTRVDNGIRQTLLWRALEGGRETYREERHITGQLRDDGRAFLWKWHTRREALRDHALIMSEWALKHPDGRLINYHGLGLRPPWMWRFPGAWAGAVEVDGRATEPLEACGATATSVGFWGLIDGAPRGTRAAVTIRQGHDFPWFVLKDDFPYLAVGPTIGAPKEVRAGDGFEECYEIEVEDRP
ncbi:MAG: DUF6807 family protein [Opitutales bacterium]